MFRTIRRPALVLGAALSVLSIYSSTAFAVGPPIVTVGSASEIKLNTAVISGTVDANGVVAASSYKLEYGKTKAYGMSTPSVTLKSGSGPIPVSVQAVGMEPLSTYHFRISATNKYGTTVSEDGVVELLKSWKVEGVPIASLGAPATYTDEYKGGLSEGGDVNFKGEYLGSQVKIYCNQSTNSSTGALGLEYNELNFKNQCSTEVNGTKLAECVPVGGITLHLNGLFAQTAPTKVVLGSGFCPIGNELTFESGGYGILATSPEAVRLGFSTKGTTYTPGKAWSSEYHTGIWHLTGSSTGKKYGIS
jgi:hypothetical protein